MRPCGGDTGGHTGTAPTNFHQTTRCAITSSHCTFDSPRQPRGVPLPHRIAHWIAPNHAVCHTPSYYTFDSSKPCGVPLPHRGYTFDGAGLASATQPTLGNDVSEEATPLGVVLFPPHCFLISSHTHIGGGNASRTPAPIL